MYVHRYRAHTKPMRIYDVITLSLITHFMNTERTDVDGKREARKNQTSRRKQITYITVYPT